MTGTSRHIALTLALAVLAATLAACGADDYPTPTPRVIIQEPPAPTPTAAMQDSNFTGGTANPNAAPYDLTFYEHAGVNPFVDTEDDRLSTFAIDVDTASYTVARRYVRDGNMPDPASVRVEEFVNYFDYDYAPPTRDPFAIHVEGSPSPFGGENHWLMRVGLQAREVGERQRKDATLIFAIDVSGSMGREDRLGLVRRSLALLVDELRPRDSVGIVTYGDRGQVLLWPTDGGERGAIMAAINSLTAGGSTYAEEGLRIAYEMAANEVHPERITRVMLLSDGVGNVGRTSADEILEQIRADVDRGVTLTTVGFGMGNYNDVLMEQLANDGDGAYHYVDTLSEARRVFVDDFVGTIQTVARDAKVQVEFNPDVVRSYRLLGYENRAVADEDFRDDTVDAGEIGAGHSVTALYELKFHEGAAGDIGTVSLRYEDPDTNGITEIRRSLQVRELAPWFESASPSFQLAAVVAEYAEVLRGSYWAQNGDLQRTASEADRVQRLLSNDPDVAEFADIVAGAARIEQGR
ncbi:MAG: von Willebrand factor type A domain-containing protein [Chloroflexi bacterium]|nr:von Willebrand factor type A domain-containing protein [Chloroflexota bacterium]